MQQPVTKSSEGRIADDNVPITSKHSRSHEEPMLPSLRSWQAPCPSDGDASMPVPPCIIPCTAADCTHFSTAPAPAQQQQPQTQQQSHHIMQQQQVQLQLQQSRSQSSQHSSSSHAIQPGAARQKHADHAVMATPPHDDQSLVEADSSLSLRERLGQSSASRAASNVKGKTGRQQETSRQQGIHGSLGRHAPPVGAAVAGPTVCDGMARRHESSSTFGDGLRPCSPSECCSHEAAARAQGAHLLLGQLCLSQVCCVVIDSLTLPVRR